MKKFGKLILTLALAGVMGISMVGCFENDNSSDTGSTNTGSTDTGSTDTGSTDTGSSDTGSSDTGSSDTGSTDTGSSDTTSSDTGSSDTGSSDTTSSDTTSSDTTSSDTTSSDTTSSDTGSDTPGTDTPSGDPVRFEAETDAVISGTVNGSESFIDEAAAASGGQCLGSLSAIGNTITFTFTAAEAGTAEIVFGMSSSTVNFETFLVADMTLDQTVATVSLNGVNINYTSQVIAGQSSTNMSGYNEVFTDITMGTQNIVAGENTVVITIQVDGTGAPNIDYMDVISNVAISSNGTSSNPGSSDTDSSDTTSSDTTSSDTTSSDTTSSDTTSSDTTSSDTTSSDTTSSDTTSSDTTSSDTGSDTPGSDVPSTEGLLGAEWLVTHTEGERVTYVFEAECTDLGGKEGPGYSGTAPESSMAVGWSDESGIGGSGEGGVSFLYRMGMSVNFIIVSDRDVDDATLQIRLGAEFLNLNIDPNSYRIRIDDVTEADLTDAAGQWDEFFLNYDYEGNGLEDTRNTRYIDVWDCESINIDATGGVEVLGINDYTITTQLSLKRGVTSISLVTWNNNAPGMGTMAANAPVVDAIKITTNAQLGMCVQSDNGYGAPGRGVSIVG